MASRPDEWLSQQQLPDQADLDAWLAERDRAAALAQLFSLSERVLSAKPLTFRDKSLLLARLAELGERFPHLAVTLGQLCTQAVDGDSRHVIAGKRGGAMRAARLSPARRLSVAERAAVARHGKAH